MELNESEEGGSFGDCTAGDAKRGHTGVIKGSYRGHTGVIQGL